MLDRCQTASVVIRAAGGILSAEAWEIKPTHRRLSPRDICKALGEWAYAVTDALKFLSADAAEVIRSPALRTLRRRSPAGSPQDTPSP
jgi:hypothetical protein